MSKVVFEIHDKSFTAFMYGDDESRGKYSHFDDQVTIYVGSIWHDTEDFDKFVEGLSVILLTELICLAYHGQIETIADLTCFESDYWGNNCKMFKGACKSCNSDYQIKLHKGL